MSCSVKMDGHYKMWGFLKTEEISGIGDTNCMCVLLGMSSTNEIVFLMPSFAGSFFDSTFKNV